MAWVAPVASGAASGLGSIFGGKEQAAATTHAADVTSAAANHAADVQAQSAKEALAFQEAQAQNTAQNNEANRAANYALMAAKAAKFGSIGDVLGRGLGGGVTPPPYVPGVLPNFTAGQPNATPPAGTPTAPQPDQPPPVAAQPFQRSVMTAPAPPTSPTPAPGLVLQPDGTYALPNSIPRIGSVGSYLQ